MRKSNLLVKSIITASVLVPSLASAQSSMQPLPSPSIAAAAVPEKEDSINLSPIGLLYGNVALSYEHLWNGTHGLVLEAEGSRASNDDSSATSGGFGVGYRWHWSHKQDSGFLGIMATQSIGTGFVTYGENGSTMKYDMAIRATTLTANIGKRWMIGDNINITARLGAGPAWRHASTDTAGPRAKDAEDTMNALLSLIPVSIDGELSAGIVF
jgi:hypothetical protein